MSRKQIIGIKILKYNKIVKIYKYINNRTNNKVTEETSQ